jgi:hypothetical protein
MLRALRRPLLREEFRKENSSFALSPATRIGPVRLGERIKHIRNFRYMEGTALVGIGPGSV